MRALLVCMCVLVIINNCLASHFTVLDRNVGHIGAMFHEALNDTTDMHGLAMVGADVG